MRVKYLFSSRRNRHVDNIRKQRGKFPKIADKLIKDADILIQVLDSRFISETRNIELEESIKEQGKLLIYVLNKSDIADKNKISRKKLKELYPYVFTSCSKRRGIKELRDVIKRESKKIDISIKKDNLNKITVGVMGYPNTGKSSIINLLIGKTSAPVAQEGGFTKGIQKIKLTPEIYLIDSPGVIPKDEYSSVKTEFLAKYAKISVKSYSQIKNPEQAVHELMKEFPKKIEKFYGIKADGNSDILIEEIGRRRKFMKKGNNINEDKAARFILKDWQAGKIKI